MWNLYYLSGNIKIVDCGQSATALMLQLLSCEICGKYRGSKGRHELSARGDQVWEF